MNKVKLLSATAILVAALAAPGFAQDRGGGGTAGAGAGVSGPGGGGGSAGGGAAISGPGGGGSAGGRAAVSGGASQGRSFGGSAGAPSARGEFSGGGMRTGSAHIGVRGGSDRTFATDRGDWRGGWRHHHRHGGRFVVGGYNSYAYGGDCYLVRKRVLTPFGWRVRRVQVCH
jgi:hypothetical protein